MKPLLSERNFTPSSTAFGSLASGPGVADVDQMLHGHDACAWVLATTDPAIKPASAAETMKELRTVTLGDTSASAEPRIRALKNMPSPVCSSGASGALTLS